MDAEIQECIDLLNQTDQTQTECITLLTKQIQDLASVLPEIANALDLVKDSILSLDARIKELES